MLHSAWLEPPRSPQQATHAGGAFADHHRRHHHQYQHGKGSGYASGSGSSSCSAFECAICLEEYDERRAPPELIQPCGHTFCLPCLRRHRGVPPNSSSSVGGGGVARCPICRAVISGSAPNRALLAALPKAQGGGGSAAGRLAEQQQQQQQLEQANLAFRKQVLGMELQTCLDREASAAQAAAMAAERAADAATAAQAAGERAERAREEERALAAEAKEEREARILVESSLREVEEMLNRHRLAEKYG